MPLVLSQPAAEIAFWVTVGAWSVGERILTFRDIRSGARRGGQDAGSYFWVVAGVIGGFAAGIALADNDALTLPAPVVWLVIGLITAWAGMLVRLWAVLTLGQYFTTWVQVRSDQQVITNGPYRFVRHPSYLGLLIMFLGLGVALGDLASAVAMVVLPIIGLVKRIMVEETAPLPGSATVTSTTATAGRASSLASGDQIAGTSFRELKIVSQGDPSSTITTSGAAPSRGIATIRTVLPATTGTLSCGESSSWSGRSLSGRGHPKVFVATHSSASRGEQVQRT